MNRLKTAQGSHLRKRLREVAGRDGGEVWHNGTLVAGGLTIVPTRYDKVVQSEESANTGAGMFVWLIGVDELDRDYGDGDEIRVDGNRYRVTIDPVTERFWQPNGHSGAMRAVFTTEWA